MTQIQRFEFDDQYIREENGKYSIFDTIKIIGQQKSPREVWKRLTERYPEVVTRCNNFKFPGRGQRLTPVTDREGIIKIIGLLPGAVGKKFRNDQAKLLCRYLDADITLADEIIQRQTDVKALKWQKERIEGKIIRQQFTNELSKRGVHDKGYAMNTDAINTELFDHTAKELKAIRNVKNTRDGLSEIELIAVRFAEKKAILKMEEQDAYGNYDTTKCSRQAGRAVRKALDS